MRSFYVALGVAYAFVVMAAPVPSGAKMAKATLLEPGYVKVSGGCECYAEGTLNFSPAEGGVLVTLDNAGGWYFDGSKRREDFSVVAPGQEFSALYHRLRALFTDGGELRVASTRAAVVELRLPLKEGVFSLTAREVDGAYDFDAILAALDDFVEMCATGRWPNVKKG